MVKVRVFVTLKPSLLDSAGRTVQGSLQKLGHRQVKDVRIGKLLELELEEYNEDQVRQMCKQLLANPVIEDYQIEVVAEGAKV